MVKMEFLESLRNILVNIVAKLDESIKNLNKELLGSHQMK